ncbi:MAG: CerR family C-terminal domain-containing protein [bacterium]
MEKEPSETKLSLILAAGELFAELGLEGVGIRTIAKKAGVNIAAVNYHFGSKEHLYTETLKYAALHGGGIHPISLSKDGEDIQGPAEIAESLYTYIKEKFVSLFASGQSSWYSKLIIRSLLEPTPSLQSTVDQIFLPTMESLITIIQRADPNMTKEKARLWAFSIEGEIAFYGICKVPILLILRKKEYDNEFIDAAADHVARSSLTALGLPQPEESEL